MSRLKQVFVSLAAAVVVLASVQAFGLNPADKEAVKARIKPAGELCLQGQACAAAAASAASGPRSGEAVFNATCMACHATGAAGAPKSGDKAAWAPRIAQGKPTLYEHALAGIRGMPPRGTCANCSDDEIHAAVDYMVEKSK